MRAFFLAVLGLIVGYVVGIGLALAVGIVGTALFGDIPSLRLVAIGCALAFAVAAPILDSRRERSPGNGR